MRHLFKHPLFKSRLGILLVVLLSVVILSGVVAVPYALLHKSDTVVSTSNNSRTPRDKKADKAALTEAINTLKTGTNTSTDELSLAKLAQ